MTVFVDTAQHRYGRMIMCHMIAHSTEELLDMADKIGVNRKWIQGAGTYREHFDICKTKRALAIKLGAVEASFTDIGRIIIGRKRRLAKES